tara:strand:- start:2919 stop:4058 length:1140 start_codon:yes stop_codon:yes gene_type:complete
MLKIIKKLKLNYLILKNIFKLADQKIKILFYSESKFYQKYSHTLIQLLAKKYPNEIYYVSSDINDVVENSKINNLFIGNGFLMKIFFAVIKAEYFFLTLTDLDNHNLKKNKNIKKYIYFFHVAGSTFKGYTKGAFDNYDIILCNGQFQIDEIRFREKQKKIKKKRLILTGYFYFDHISKKINIFNKPTEILFAPSWTYKYKNYINPNCIKIIHELIKKNYYIAFRPHPEHYRRSQKILREIKYKFGSYKNFRFDNDVENIKSLEKAKCLITDTSGIYLEYMLLLNRPVLFLEGIDKIHNDEYSDFNNFKPVEQDFKEKFGLTFSENEIKNIDLLIENSIKSFHSKIPQLNQLKNTIFFNFGKTIEKFETIIESQIFDKD